MTVSPARPGATDTQAVLAAALSEVHGAGVELEAWTEEVLSKRGKHRVVRYDLQARVAGDADVHHYQWVGKFYERDRDARAVAAVLRALSATHYGARGGFVVPTVLAYDAPLRLLLLSYEAGESVTKAIGRDGARVLAAIGRALAVLHAAPVTAVARTNSPPVLGDVRSRIAELSARFPTAAASLRRALTRLERKAPPAPPTVSFLHGDLGPVQLRWQGDRIVFLDFDDCTRGDPALDLGNLLTQLRRLALRKPGKLPDFAVVRTSILDAYRRAAPDDPGLMPRVAWHEEVTLLRKIHTLTFDWSRHPEADAIEQRQAEAIGLLATVP